MLEVRNLDAFYGAMQVLHGVNLAIGSGEIVGLVGANAAGKSRTRIATPPTSRSGLRAVTFR